MAHQKITEMKTNILISVAFIFSSFSVLAVSVDENVPAILKERIAASPEQQRCAKDSGGVDCSQVIDASKGIIVSDIHSSESDVSGIVNGKNFIGDVISRKFVMQKSNLSFNYQ